MTVYNEIEPYACEWIEGLIAAGEIPAGKVDGRDIRELKGADCGETTHLFAGIGGWPAALRLAGWDESRACWTISCPCPPFSCAGRKKSCPSCGGASPIPCPRRTGYFLCCGCGHAWEADDRHLWPEAWRLVEERRPSVIFGEQVPGRDGLLWLAGVRASLELLGYSVGSLDLAAAGIASPHIRQRLYWVAERLADPAERGLAGSDGCREHVWGPRQAGGDDRLADSDGPFPIGRELRLHAEDGGEADRLADSGPSSSRHVGGSAGEDSTERGQEAASLAGRGPVGGLADAGHDVRPGSGIAGRSEPRGLAEPVAGRGLGLAEVEGLEVPVDVVVRGPRRGNEGRGPQFSGDLDRLADAAGKLVDGRLEESLGQPEGRDADRRARAGHGSGTGGMADAGEQGIRVHERRGDAGPQGGAEVAWPQRQRLRPDAGDARASDGLADGERYEGRSLPAGPWQTLSHAFWGRHRVIPCGDGKLRRISAEPGDVPLAYGIPQQLGPLLAKLERLGVDSASAKRAIRAARRNRVGRLKGYGNAIVPPLAAMFIRFYMESRCESVPA